MPSRSWEHFLADLDLVNSGPGRETLSPDFFSDLDHAYNQASTAVRQEPTVGEIKSIGAILSEWRGRYERLMRHYSDQLPPDDPLLNPVSLFGTMDYGRLEIAHTRALAWLLGDREHGFRHELLEALVRHLTEDRTISQISVSRVESEWPIYCGPLAADMGRIDVLAEGKWQKNSTELAWRLVIETKIDADEAEEQLSRYDSWLDPYPERTHETLRIFLTPDGREPDTSAAEWRAFSFVELASLFRRVATGLQGRPGYHFLRYYITGVLRDICGVPIPIVPNCDDPYRAVDCLRSVLGVAEQETGHG